MNLSAVNWDAGTIYPLTCFFHDAAGVGVTGLSPEVEIRRSSDGYVLNSGGTWVTPTGSPTLPTAVVVDATYKPGLYRHSFTLPAAAYGVTYDITVDGSATPVNRYWEGVVFSNEAEETATTTTATSEGADAILDAIETNATGPAKVTVDGQSVTQHSLQDQIAAAEAAKARDAGDKKGWGMRFAQLQPPGTA